MISRSLIRLGRKSFVDDKLILKLFIPSTLFIPILHKTFVRIIVT
jgi:hypothetical protein